MSTKQNLQNFLNWLKTDNATKETLTRASQQTAFAQVVVQTGAQKGFSFTIEDVKDAVREAIGGSRELSDAELEAVAGAGEDLGTLACQTFGAC
jgi:predicted ribosomally synthesized peptide with nif11-like leader